MKQINLRFWTWKLFLVNDLVNTSRVQIFSARINTPHNLDCFNSFKFKISEFKISTQNENLHYDQPIQQSTLTLFRWTFLGCSRMGAGVKKAPLSKICHTSYNDETWHSYTLPKEDLKTIWITWHISWVLLTSAFFYWKWANFAISRNTDTECISIHFYFF